MAWSLDNNLFPTGIVIIKIVEYKVKDFLKINEKSGITCRSPKESFGQAECRFNLGWFCKI
jgi:hypothetical protein